MKKIAKEIESTLVHIAEKTYDKGPSKDGDHLTDLFGGKQRLLTALEKLIGELEELSHLKGTPFHEALGTFIEHSGIARLFGSTFVYEAVNALDAAIDEGIFAKRTIFHLFIYLFFLSAFLAGTAGVLPALLISLGVAAPVAAFVAGIVVPASFACASLFYVSRFIKNSYFAIRDVQTVKKELSQINDPAGKATYNAINALKNHFNIDGHIDYKQTVSRLEKRLLPLVEDKNKLTTDTWKAVNELIKAKIKLRDQLVSILPTIKNTLIERRKKSAAENFNNYFLNSLNLEPSKKSEALTSLIDDVLTKKIEFENLQNLKSFGDLLKRAWNLNNIQYEAFKNLLRSENQNAIELVKSQLGETKGSLFLELIKNQIGILNSKQLEENLTEAKKTYEASKEQFIKDNFFDNVTLHNPTHYTTQQVIAACGHEIPANFCMDYKRLLSKESLNGPEKKKLDNLKTVIYNAALRNINRKVDMATGSFQTSINDAANDLQDQMYALNNEIKQLEIAKNVQDADKAKEILVGSQKLNIELQSKTKAAIRSGRATAFFGNVLAGSSFGVAAAAFPPAAPVLAWFSLGFLLVASSIIIPLVVESFRKEPIPPEKLQKMWEEVCNAEAAKNLLASENVKNQTKNLPSIKTPSIKTQSINKPYDSKIRKQICEDALLALYELRTQEVRSAAWNAKFRNTEKEIKFLEKKANEHNWSYDKLKLNIFKAINEIGEKNKETTGKFFNAKDKKSGKKINSSEFQFFALPKKQENKDSFLPGAFASITAKWAKAHSKDIQEMKISHQEGEKTYVGFKLKSRSSPS